MTEADLNEQITSQLPALRLLQRVGYGYLVRQVPLPICGGWLGRLLSIGQPVESISEPCYNMFTSPPAFRGGVRGGLVPPLLLTMGAI